MKVRPESDVPSGQFLLVVVADNVVVRLQICPYGLVSRAVPEFSFDLWEPRSC